MVDNGLLRPLFSEMFEKPCRFRDSSPPRNIMRSRRRPTLWIECFLQWAFLLLVASGTTLVAQTVTGSITGLVTDPSGAVIADAAVTAENTATSIRTSTRTNAAGGYALRFLPIGNYTVTVEAKGFTTQKISPFTLDIDQTAKIDARI